MQDTIRLMDYEGFRFRYQARQDGQILHQADRAIKATQETFRQIESGQFFPQINPNPTIVNYHSLYERKGLQKQ